MSEPSTSSAYTARFCTASNESIEHLLKERIPPNTQRKVKWVMGIFNSWYGQWRARLTDELKVLKEMSEWTNNEINYVLKYFFCEINKVDGTPYPPRTLKEICACIQHHFNYSLHRSISLFKDNDFCELRQVLDAVMKKGAKEGLIKPKKQAQVISMEAEDKLWMNGTFGDDTPEKLLRTLIYLLGLHLSLRASQEHRDLEYGEHSQLALNETKAGEKILIYTERMSKNKQFGLRTCNAEPKVTSIHQNMENPDRCVVRLFEKYINHRPEQFGKKGCSAFYLSPMPPTQIKSDNQQWYKSVPLGIHSIESTTKNAMKNLSDEEGFFTNTSLRRTAKNRLIQNGIPPEVAAKKTGRISDMADQAYISRDLYERQMTHALYGNKEQSTINNHIEKEVRFCEPVSSITTSSTIVRTEERSNEIIIEVNKGDKKVKIIL